MNNIQISFVVIGKNEGWKITNCLKSINNTITENHLYSYEILYIDSGSHDDSIERAEKFENVKIFKITSKNNAAIARNIGAKESKGETLFFIDGDMEIIPETLKLIFTPENGLIYEFVSGNFENNYYSQSGEFIKAENYYNLENDIFQVTTGGLFLISRNLWEKIGGMRPIFRRSQDVDLALRLSKFGYKLLRKKEVLAKHHTISYVSSNRFFEDILNGNYLYRGLLYKMNFLNKYIYKNYLSKEITLLIILLSIFLSFVYSSIIYLLIYPLMLTIKLIYKRKNFKISFILQFVYHFNSDLMTLISLLFFWPKDSKDVIFKQIK